MRRTFVEGGWVRGAPWPFNRLTRGLERLAGAEAGLGIPSVGESETVLGDPEMEVRGDRERVESAGVEGIEVEEE